jgi:hypothetical protein
VNQIGAAELQIVFLAEFVELLQVNTRHKSPLVATAIKYLRVDRPRPTGKFQPVDASAVFNAVGIRRRGQTLTDSLLGHVEQGVVNDGAYAAGIAGGCDANHFRPRFISFELWNFIAHFVKPPHVFPASTAPRPSDSLMRQFVAPG